MIERLTRLLPSGGEMDVDAVLQPLESRCGLVPFADEAVELLRIFADRLSSSPTAASSPELQALAFWLRPSAVARWRQDFEALRKPGIILAPRGLVLHFAPANVDLHFAYSWVFALLTGNVSVIRLSERHSADAKHVIEILNEIAVEEPHLKIERHLALVAYGHDDELTAQLSAAADVRVIWGGDDTVRRLRRIPLPAHAVELCFPDRRSFALIDVQAYLQLGAAEARRLAESFFNDAYVYDQMACSSPRLVLWCGGSASDMAAASDQFFRGLQDVISERGYEVPVAVALNKHVFGHRACLDEPLTGVTTMSNELAVATLEGRVPPGPAFCGGGFFFQARIESLQDVVALVERDHQTVTHFGFSTDQMQELALNLGAAGVHRLVPVGEALAFGRFWDGFDLLAEFSRHVVLK